MGWPGSYQPEYVAAEFPSFSQHLLSFGGGLPHLQVSFMKFVRAFETSAALPGLEAAVQRP